MVLDGIDRKAVKTITRIRAACAILFAYARDPRDIITVRLGLGAVFLMKNYADWLVLPLHALIVW